MSSPALARAGAPAGAAVAPELEWMKDDPERLRWTARELEATLIRDLLAAGLRPGESAFWGKGPGAEVYGSLFLEALARELAQTGSFGIADLLVNQLMPAVQAGDTPEPGHAPAMADAPVASNARMADDLRMPCDTPVALPEAYRSELARRGYSEGRKAPATAPDSHGLSAGGRWQH